MKKLIGICLAIAVVLGISGSVYAADDVLQGEKTIQVEIRIVDTFGFKIWDTQYSQKLYPFGNDPNDPKRAGAQFGAIHFYCTSNLGTTWYLKAAAPMGGCINQDAPAEDPVPLIMNTWAATGNAATAAKGAFATNLELTPSAQTIYTSAPEESVTKVTELDAQFYAKDDVQFSPGGIYKGPLVITMTQ